MNNSWSVFQYKFCQKFNYLFCQENALEEIVCSVSTNFDKSRYAGNMPEPYQYWPDVPKLTQFWHVKRLKFTGS